MSSHPGATGKSRKHESSTPTLRREHLRRILLGVLYLSALSMLIVWEYRERLESRLSSECDLRDQVKSSLYNHTYSKFLDWAASNAAGHVVTVAIPEDLEEVQSNLCLGRAYMADVLQSLATRNPAVVVIDKFYGESACASQPAVTKSLIDSVRALKVPVVIGESSNGIETAIQSACLVHKPKLEFDTPNVHYGLTRFNNEPERIPLRWAILPSIQEVDGHAPLAEHEVGIPANAESEFADSLALTAVKAYDPDFAAQRSIQQLIQRDDHAYANVSSVLPHTTTTALLCSSGDQGMLQRWSVNCNGKPTLPNMAGRIVVIGAESSTDEKVVVDRHIWGFQLQALYMETLLSGDYLRYLPTFASFALFALFIFLIEGGPVILVARRPRWRKLPFLRYAYRTRRYVWVLIWAGATILGSAVFCLALRYLPPLLVYGDILLITVSRLLFFVAESAEHPFLHAHTHKAHRTSVPAVSPPSVEMGTVLTASTVANHDSLNSLPDLPVPSPPDSKRPRTKRRSTE
jgi:CHASE2 domain-containing sensor protein